MRRKIKFPWNISSYKNLGIDLGTTNTLIYVKGKGIALCEPSLLTINTKTQEIIEVGDKSKEMLGRTPKGLKVISPLKEGAIADFDITHSMIKHFLDKVLGKKHIFKPIIVISVPYGTTPVEKRSVTEVARLAGAKDVLLIEEPLAAAIGANLSVENPQGKMIVNIGGGKSEIAIISLGGIVQGLSIRVGGNSINKTIIDYIRKNYRIEIGERTSEKLKMEIGYAVHPKINESLEIKGINLKTGLPTSINITAEEIHLAIKDILKLIVNTIKKIYEKTPPQLASDIIETGITLTGGGSLLKNFDVLINKELNLPVILAENPETCVVLGTGKVTSELNEKFTQLSIFRS